MRRIARSQGDELFEVMTRVLLKLGGYVGSWNVLMSYRFTMWYECYFSTHLSNDVGI
jgi:hypothetical protein